jgi:hypothetical protein
MIKIVSPLPSGVSTRIAGFSCKIISFLLKSACQNNFMFPVFPQLTGPKNSGEMLINNTQNRKADRRQINILNEWEVDYWARRLGCSKHQLVEAVGIAGTSPVKVARHLEKYNRRTGFSFDDL